MSNSASSNATASTFDFGNLDALRLRQDFHQTSGVQKVLVRVPVRKPHRQEFIRVNTDQKYKLQTGLLEVKEDREFYLLSPDVRDQWGKDYTPVRLVTAITRQGSVFLWPLKLPLPDGRSSAWFDTAMECADIAEKHWVKVVADMNLGGYEPYKALGELPEPEWPRKSFSDLLKIAFRDRVIEDMNHPVIARLLGRE
jgi:hypothetical protein